VIRAAPAGGAPAWHAQGAFSPGGVILPPGAARSQWGAGPAKLVVLGGNRWLRWLVSLLGPSEP